MVFNSDLRQKLEVPISLLTCRVSSESGVRLDFARSLVSLKLGTTRCIFVTVFLFVSLSFLQEPFHFEV